MSSTIPYQEHATESVDLAEEEVPTIVLPNGDRLEFPGCRAYKMALSELEEYEGRYEYWYGPTETLIVVADEPRVSGDHELPASYLMQLVQQIADECGAHFVLLAPLASGDKMHRAYLGSSCVPISAFTCVLSRRGCPIKMG